MGTWKPGEQVVLREMWKGRVWSARPALVVKDDDEELMTFFPAGTVMKYAVDEDGRELRLYTGRWDLADHLTMRSTLGFSWPEEARHAVLALWEPDWKFAGWYVNLETFLSRAGRCYDFVDHILDILVPPDRSSWAWKDEEELEEAVRAGVIPAEQITALRAEGERAVRRLLEGEPPFDREWASWRPDPEWPAPVFMEGWDRVRR
jgi:predicted RNA-binding protein associated with RNAse of E/G family